MKTMFFFGIGIIAAASLLRSSAFPPEPMGMTRGEFLSLLGIGTVMTLPAIVYQLYQLLTSARPDDSPMHLEPSDTPDHTG
ncbi:hypothetical protein EGT07_13420 [Herbaspirillum sp. HC18]|nr:hypothetical protein EGT07_13420 [Herbaspirillum sp. HC18]